MPITSRVRTRLAHFGAPSFFMSAWPYDDSKTFNSGPPTSATRDLIETDNTLL